MKEEFQKLHDELFQETLKKRAITLNPIQLEKFSQACWKAIQDNEGATFNELMIATMVYLNFIIDFPDVTL